ncbi:hypothetical protein [Streptomyces sp. XD-27]|uniref:hypothetical protein n=1 Tax=Streptomyces sp. XD-27 TaxID=3062779 RepID=UPI0026F44D24|nr:hypothetical protein [Streptomyces sp. XD-27]WKX70875.1 hypothetical protein Q3Y56_14040 [Streptomyces sp. XD-27]
MTKKYGAWALAACAAMAMGLTGCGGDDKKDDKPTKPPAPATNGVEKLTGPEIADKAKNELTSATSMRINVSGKDEGAAMNMNMIMDTKGDCRGSMTTAEGAFELVKLGDKVWMKPDEQAMKSIFGDDKEVQKLLHGKWMYGTTTADKDLKDMTAVCDLKGLQASAGGSSESNKTFTKGAVTTLDGHQVIPVSGKNRSGEPITLSVALEGKPYPVKIVKTGADASTSTLSDFEKPVGTQTPPEMETIDMDELAKSSG